MALGLNCNVHHQGLKSIQKQTFYDDDETISATNLKPFLCVASFWLFQVSPWWGEKNFEWVLGPDRCCLYLIKCKKRLLPAANVMQPFAVNFCCFFAKQTRIPHDGHLTNPHQWCVSDLDMQAKKNIRWHSLPNSIIWWIFSKILPGKLHNILCKLRHPSHKIFSKVTGLHLLKVERYLS